MRVDVDALSSPLLENMKHFLVLIKNGHSLGICSPETKEIVSKAASKLSKAQKKTYQKKKLIKAGVVEANNPDLEDEKVPSMDMEAREKRND